MELLTMRRTVARLLPVVLLAASAAAAHAQVESETTNSIFLRGTGATSNPATLFLDTGGPTATVPKTKDATALRFAGGNAWKEIGTWGRSRSRSPTCARSSPTSGRSTSGSGSSTATIRARSSTSRAELFKVSFPPAGGSTTFLIAEATQRCISGLVRDPNRATEVRLSPLLTAVQSFNATTDILRLKLSARIGTNDNGTQCAGSHASAAGLRAYFDAVRRESRLGADLSNGLQPVGQITADIMNFGGLNGEAPMGDVVADSMLQATATAGAQFALMNPGGVRRGLVFVPDGEVTFAEAFDVLPFGFRLVTVTLTGAQILAALEQQFQIINGVPMQRILQPSAGFTFSWRSTQPLGSRISNVQVNGTPIDPAASYRVTINSFLAAGNDGFSALAGGTNATTDGSDLDALIDYLLAHLHLAPPPADRITRIE